MVAEPTTIRLRRDISSDWTAKNPILASGELGLELDTKRIRMGDGRTRWNSLDYIAPWPEMIEMIEEAIADLVIDGGGVSIGQLNDHVNSATPHPAYDDGPSFELLYQNAKV
jgi:hypothetical protein